MKIYKDYYKKIEEYMDGLTKNITIANEEELESILEALEKVDFDSHLTNLAEKSFFNFNFISGISIYFTIRDIQTCYEISS